MPEGICLSIASPTLAYANITITTAKASIANWASRRLAGRGTGSTLGVLMCLLRPCGFRGCGAARPGGLLALPVRLGFRLRRRFRLGLRRGRLELFDLLQALVDAGDGDAVADLALLERAKGGDRLGGAPGDVEELDGAEVGLHALENHDLIPFRPYEV